MNTTELVAKIAEAHGVSKAQAKSIVDDILKDIVTAAASGAEVSLPGFGKFKVKATPEREGRNPANGEKIKIAASKKLTFSSAKSVKEIRLCARQSLKDLPIGWAERPPRRQGGGSVADNSGANS